MIGPNARAALSALAAARPTVARLDAARDAEENAADLIEAWSALETALRSLVGGSVLAGQPLIRELRQREMLNIDQAHSLLEFLAVRERVQRTEYRPTRDDVSVAREAYSRVEQGLMASPAEPAATAAPTTSTAAGIATSTPLDDSVAQPRSRRASVAYIAAGLVALIALAGITWYVTSRSGGERSLRRGAELYRAGRRQEARREFEIAARKSPDLALAHVYLGRIAREEGDTSAAFEELRRAVELDTTSAVAHRELASFLLTQRRYEPARRFYVRALKQDPSDRSAQGFLGCALLALGRAQEGLRWIERAGPGDWSSCVRRFAPLPAAPFPQAGMPMRPPA